MKHDTKEKEAYTKAWQNVKLSESARHRIEENLTQYVAFHGVADAVREEEVSRSIEREPQNSIFGISSIRHFRFNTMTALILIAVLVGGGTSFAAEGALPGDMLYPIKVEVNEEVKGAFAFGSEADARLQAKLVAERLEEAEELAAEGMLTAEVAAEIEARMKAHAESARTESAEAEANGDSETAATIRAELVATLDAYANILSKFNATATNTGTNALIIEVENERDETVEAQATATIDLDVDAGILKVNTGATGSATRETSSESESDTDDGIESSTDVDLEIDTTVDTGLLDAGLESDTNVRTNTGIGL